MTTIRGIDAAPSVVTMTGAMPVTRIVPARPMTNAPHQFVSFARPPPAYSSSSRDAEPAPGSSAMDLLLLFRVDRDTNVRKYTKPSVESSLYTVRQPVCKKLWWRSTRPSGKTWPPRPLPVPSASGYTCRRQPVRCRVPAFCGPGSEAKKRRPHGRARPRLGERRRAVHATPDGGGGARVHPRQRHRVPVRAVRGHARQAEREARAGLALRRPADRRRGLRGLRGGRHRPDAELAGHGGDAGHPHAHAAPLPPERRAVRLRRLRRGRGVAVRPAHDPPP